jgi:preprotein translocase subunit SecG
MLTLVTIVHVIVCIFLVITILFQFGKGASLGSSFGGSGGQALHTTSGPMSILSKATIACAVIFMLTSLYLTYVVSAPGSSSVMKSVRSVKEAPAPITAPVTTPAPAPIVVPSTPEAK